MSQLQQDVQAKVDFLLKQYADYLDTMEQIGELKSRYMAGASSLAASAGTSLRDILKSPANYPRLTELSSRRAATETRLQKISDEMTFANPLVWIAYKYQAYQGTSTAILTMEDLRKHCAKPDYICTKRYTFLRSYLLANSNLDLDNLELFPPSLSLPLLYQDPRLEALVGTADFMSQWEEYEYHIEDGKVSKWTTFQN